MTFNCGLDLVGEVLFGKWKIRLLYFIHEGFRRPSELHRKIPDATPRVLNMQLNELLQHQLVEKTIYTQIPLKVEYQLTAFGESLVPVISLLGEWGDNNREKLLSVLTQE